MTTVQYGFLSISDKSMLKVQCGWSFMDECGHIVPWKVLAVVYSITYLSQSV